jgi:putative flippase GtrA
LSKFLKKLNLGELLKRVASSEFILYIIVGVLTTLINFVTYAVFVSILKDKFPDTIYILISNTLAFIIAVIFAYVADKVLVFKNKDFSKEGIIRELASFISARLISFGIGSLITILVVKHLKSIGMAPDIADKVGKLPEYAFNVLFNYIVSKFFIFKKKD